MTATTQVPWHDPSTTTGLADGATRFVLTSAESREVARIADRLLGGIHGLNPLEHVYDIRLAAENLPLRLRQFLAGARVCEAEVFLVSGLPVSPDLPPTPNSWAHAERSGAGLREELVLLLCGSLVGDPFCWSTQQNGRLIHDVCPSASEEHSLTSASSRSALSLHTEDVHHDCRCDYVALFCLRNPDAVGTSLVRFEAGLLRPGTRQVLGEDRFRFRPDDSHARNGHDEWANSVARPVLSGPEDRPYLRFDTEFMAAQDDTAADAISEAAQRFEAAIEQVVLQPGDTVFLDNYRVIHGRNPFSPRYDGSDRWLKRVNLARDIRRTHRKLGTRSRVIE